MASLGLSRPVQTQMHISNSLKTEDWFSHLSALALPPCRPATPFRHRHLRAPHGRRQRPRGALPGAAGAARRRRHRRVRPHGGAGGSEGGLRSPGGAAGDGEQLRREKKVRGAVELCSHALVGGSYMQPILSTQSTLFTGPMKSLCVSQLDRDSGGSPCNHHRNDIKQDDDMGEPLHRRGVGVVA